MGEDDRYRIESRLRGMQRGISPQPEDIETLRQRQRESDKQNQREPERPFSTYLEGNQERRREPDTSQDSSEDSQHEGQSAQTGDENAEPAGSELDSTEATLPPAVANDRAHLDRQAQALQQRLAQRLDHRQAQAGARPTFFKDQSKKPPPEGSGRRS